MTSSLRLREHQERQERLELAEDEGRAVLAERRTMLDSVEVIAAFAEDMNAYLRKSELTESRAFVRSFVKDVAVAPGKATIRYTIPMPQDSPIAGQDSESLTLQSAVLPTVRLGTPERTRTSAFGSGGRHSIR